MTHKPSTARQIGQPSEPNAGGENAAETVNQHRDLIRAVRRGQRVQDGLAAVLGSVAVILVTFLVAAFAAKQSPPISRAVIWLGAGLLMVLSIMAAVRAFVRLRTDIQVARFLNRRSPLLARQILGALELHSELDRQRFSRELTVAFIRSVDKTAASTDIKPLIDRAATRFAALLALTAIAATGFIFAFDGPSLLRAISAASRRAPPSRAERMREPITGDVELFYRYPAYTGLSPRTVSGTNGEISAPSGTQVEIKTRADRPVERADVAYAGTTIPFQVTQSRDLQGQLLIDKSGTYHFIFLKANGRVVATGPEIAVQAEIDSPPKVTILTPAEELEVDNNQKVVLKYEASDDYGITSLELVYQAPRSPEKRVPLKREEGRKVSGQYTWNVAELKLQPGDRVSYYLEAHDNNEFEGKKKGVSRTQFLKLYSAAEHRREAASRVEAEWEKLVGLLASRLEGPERAKQLDPEKIVAQQSVDQTALELAAALSTLSSELAQQRDTPTELWTALANVAESLTRKVRSTSDFRKAFIRYQRQGFLTTIGKQLTQVVSDEIREEEKDVLYLETLLDRQKVEQLRELTKQLNSERRELASLIDQYKKTQDEQLRQNVLQQIQQLKEHINELLQRMGELARGIRDEHLNTEALASLMKEKDLSSALDEIEKLMQQGKADEALTKLQQLGMQMDQMLQGIDQAGEQVGEASNPELAEKFQQFTEELQKTAEGQQKLAEETKNIRDRYKNKVKDRLKQKGDGVRQELTQEVEALMREYQQLSADSMNPRADHALEVVQAELENIKNALKVDDFSLAAESAARAERGAEDLRMAGEQQRQLDEIFQNPPEMRLQSKKFAERLGQNSERVKEVNKKLQQLFPPPGSMLSESDRQQLKQMSGSQRQLEKSARGLQQRMEEIGEMAPVFGPESSEQMGQAVERMGEAAQRMEGRDPGRGYGEQRAALDQLQQLQEQLKQSGGGGGKGFPLPMMRSGGRMARRQKVEIPDADQYQAPKEFRKDLLDAMKQNVPEKYKDQVKRFYEELVK